VHGGHDSIDHPRGQHDDLANCVAGIASLCKKPSYDDTYAGWRDSPLPDDGQPVTGRRDFFNMRYIY
jgi:hypothetical protein